MIEIVYEFVVKEEARDQFELAYGPGGAWSKLYARCPGFRGATLLRDTENPRRYLTIDLWDTEAQREQMLSERKAECSSLDAALGDWTESRTEVGIFRVLAEATGRPVAEGGEAKLERPVEGAAEQLAKAVLAGGRNERAGWPAGWPAREWGEPDPPSGLVRSMRAAHTGSDPTANRARGLAFCREKVYTADIYYS